MTAAHHRTDLRAVGALVFGACAIGFAPVLVRLTQTGPAAAGLWRYLFALPLLTLLALRDGRPMSERPNRFALLAGAMFAFDMSCWHYGIKFTTVANATILSNLTPVIVTLVGWIVLREAPRRLFLAGLALAMGGAWLLAAGKSAGAPPLNQPLGDGLSIATALWYSLYFIFVRQARAGMGASRIMFWTTLVGTPFMLAVALLLHERLTPLGAAGWAACVGLGVVHVAGQGSIAWALGRLPAAVTSVTVLVQPVVATLLGALLFHELLGHWQVVGGGIALAGVVVAQWASRPKPAQALAQ